ncbi:hypothetical protein [Deinococcus sp. YIM 77859]|uniref:hypothetical protein n=1 Tax=Deinococcus sp. YIM 77859 TaxID=1540221 RepID=UPI0005512695|nr:hypothetical protein [Deinococcus sp. YIM 77859]
MKLNHFPLNPDLPLYITEYAHRNPRALLGFVRGQGFWAQQVGEQVQVYHGRPQPTFRGVQVISHTRLDPDHPAFDQGVLSLIRQALVRAGYVLTYRERMAIHPRLERVVLRPPDRHPAELTVHAHLRWEWELERHSGQRWLVLRPGRRHLSALPWPAEAVQMWSAALPATCQKLHALCLDRGQQMALLRQEDGWHFANPGAATQGRWHLSFSPQALHELGLAQAAHHAAAFRWDEVQRLVQLTDLWKPFVTSLEPLEVAAPIIAGKRLRFGRGLGRDVTEVHKRGILEPPPLPVRLAVVSPHLPDEHANAQLRRELLAHLLPRHQVLRSAESRQGLHEHLRRQDQDDTLYTFWSGGEYRKLGLPPFDLARGLHTYDPASGQLQQPAALAPAPAQATQAGRQLIALVVLPDDLTRSVRDTLFQQLQQLGLRCLFSVSRTLLHRPRTEYMAWVNMAVKLARTAGAVPWDLADLPGVTEQTFFVGVDLGHDHTHQQSLPAFTLHDHRGRPLQSWTPPRRTNNERLSLAELKKGLHRLLARRSVDQVIVHRDGRFLAGEVDDFTLALHDLGIPQFSLLAIKKSNHSVAVQAEEGSVLSLDERRCLLVTNTQAALPRPTELELVHSDRLSLATLTEQVFWLTRVFMNNAQHAGSDPATIEWANGIARTGQRVPLAGWRL